MGFLEVSGALHAWQRMQPCNTKPAGPQTCSILTVLHESTEIEGTLARKTKYSVISLYAKTQPAFDEVQDWFRKKCRMITQHEKISSSEFYRKLDGTHCPARYHNGHYRSECQNCWYCGSDSHKLNQCPKRRDDNTPRIFLAAQVPPETIPLIFSDLISQKRGHSTKRCNAKEAELASVCCILAKWKQLSLHSSNISLSNGKNLTFYFMFIRLSFPLSPFSHPFPFGVYSILGFLGSSGLAAVSWEHWSRLMECSSGLAAARS